MDITISENKPTMTSREIAELVEKRHDNVVRTIKTLVSRMVIELPQFEEVKNHLGQMVKSYVFSGEKGKRDSRPTGMVDTTFGLRYSGEA